MISRSRTGGDIWHEDGGLYRSVAWAGSLLGDGDPIGDVISGENIGVQRVMQPPNKEGLIVGKLTPAGLL